MNFRVLAASVNQYYELNVQFILVFAYLEVPCN